MSLNHRRFNSEITKKKMSESHRGNLNAHWKGGKIYFHGYIYLRKPEYPNANKQGYIGEHIVIASAVLGCPLKESDDYEIVHHINEIKSDNRKENLLICANSYHSFLHGRMN
jgi:hypothetical protein